VRPNEHGAVCVQLFRKGNFVVEIKEAQEEMLGSVMFCWDDLFEGAQVLHMCQNRPICM